MRFRAPSRRASLPVAAVALGIAVSLALPGGPVVGQSSSPPVGGTSSPPVVAEIHLGGSATLLARGAAVAVPVDVRCQSNEPTTGFVTITVTQRAGNVVTSGSTSTSVACSRDAEAQQLSVVVPVDAALRAFKKGPAVTAATLSFFDSFFGAVTATDSQVIQIVR